MKRSRTDGLRGLRTLYAATGAGIGSLLPFLILYLTWRGLSPTEAGLVLGLMSAVGVLAVPVWGWLADRVLGAVRALRLSSALAAVAALALLAAGSSESAIVICAVLLAATRAPGEALADTLAVNTLDGAAHYGQVRLWASVGFALMVACWGLVLRNTSLALILLAYPVAMLAAIASTTVVRPQIARAPRPVRSRARMGAFGARFLVVLAGTLLFGVAMGVSLTVLPLRIIDVGGDVGMVGAASLIAAVAEIPLMHWSARLSDRLGFRSVVLLGGVLFAAALGLYGAVSLPVGLVVASGLRGAGYAVVYVGLVTLVGALLARDQQGTGQACLQATLMGAAPAAGASLGGLGHTHLSPGVVFGVSAALALLGAALASVGATARRSRPRSSAIRRHKRVDGPRRPAAPWSGARRAGRTAGHRPDPAARHRGDRL